MHFVWVHITCMLACQVLISKRFVAYSVSGCKFFHTLNSSIKYNFIFCSWNVSISMPAEEVVDPPHALKLVEERSLDSVVI